MIWGIILSLDIFSQMIPCLLRKVLIVFSKDLIHLAFRFVALCHLNKDFLITKKIAAAVNVECLLNLQESYVSTKIIMD